MPIYVKKSAQLDKLLKNPQLVGDIRKEFERKGPEIFRKAILADMNKSISPVKGKNKWIKYSDSYIAAIRGELGAIWAKNISPVNLRLSGELHNSLKVFGRGLLSKTYVLRVELNDFLADIHNRRGASKKKVIRRLLPTNNGEEFNYGLTRVLLNSLRDSVARVVAKYNT